MTKSTTRRFLCCLLALCCLLGSLTAFSLAAGTSYPYSASVNADTNLRRSPSSAESNIIARIPKGTILTVTGASGNFLCVTYDGQVGYIFKQYAEQLVKAGKAYYCFCTEERLNEMHEAQRAAGEMTHYDGHCRHLTQEEIDAKLAAGEPYVIRQKIPARA